MNYKTLYTICTSSSQSRGPRGGRTRGRYLGIIPFVVSIPGSALLPFSARGVLVSRAPLNDFYRGLVKIVPSKLFLASLFALGFRSENLA